MASGMCRILWLPLRYHRLWCNHCRLTRVYKSEERRHFIDQRFRSTRHLLIVYPSLFRTIYYARPESFQAFNLHCSCAESCELCFWPNCTSYVQLHTYYNHAPSLNNMRSRMRSHMRRKCSPQQLPSYGQPLSMRKPGAHRLNRVVLETTCQADDLTNAQTFLSESCDAVGSYPCQIHYPLQLPPRPFIRAIRSHHVSKLRRRVVGRSDFPLGRCSWLDASTDCYCSHHIDDAKIVWWPLRSLLRAIYYQLTTLELDLLPTPISDFA